MTDYKIINKAFELLIYDVDMSSVDENIFQKVYDEMCDNLCKECGDCRDCIRKYYIKMATKKLDKERLND